jgi:hypothetical protein
MLKLTNAVSIAIRDLTAFSTLFHMSLHVPSSLSWLAI